MKLLVVALLVIGSISSFAQSPRQYLDEKENIVAGPEGASYYRETTSKGNLYIVKDFYASNEQLAMEATCSGITPKLVYDGPYKTYHKNGALCEEGSYNKHDKRGLWKTYYENGQQEEEILYQEDKTLFQQHWDESGNAQLVNGSGHFSEKHPTFGENHREILDHVLIASYSVDPVTRDSTYIVVQETATYKKGMPGLYKMIGKTLRYPAHARRMGIEGKVFVEFVVEEDGKVRDVKVLKGPHETLNEEAARVIRMMNDWTPGKVKGKPVAQKIVLPVAFKLG
jgi:TonB family protein